jgi:transposase
MRFVTPKTEAQQTLSVLHRLRESLVHDRTKTANQMHGFLLEFGISLPKGLAIMKRLASVLAEHELPVRLTVLLQRLHDHFVYLDEQIKALDKELASQLADDDLGSRLLSMPCVGRSPPACWLWKWAMAAVMQSRLCGLCRLGAQAVQHGWQGQLAGDQQAR